LGVRFPLATTHPVWMDGEGWGVGVHWAAVTWHGLAGQGCYKVTNNKNNKSYYWWLLYNYMYCM